MKVTRRSFLKSACSGMSALPLLSTMLNLKLMQSVSAVTVPTNSEYRAIVCILLGGGNDSFNMLVPREASAYAAYQSSRANLALAPNQLININPIGAPQYAVHSAMPELAQLFESGKAAFIANVGSLIEPVQNRQQVRDNLKRLPLGLYSHSDQMEQWQTSIPHSRSGIGWIGRAADLLKDLNQNQAVPMNISLDGSNVLQTGNSVAEYSITPDGAIALNGYSPRYEQWRDMQNAMSTAVDSQLTLRYGNLLMQTFADRKRKAIEAYETFAAAAEPDLPAGVTFPDTFLGRRLRMIAKAIQGRAAMGARRQTYFIHWGGWDHHNNVIDGQAEMLPQLSAAVGAFQNAMAAINAEQNVTLFTASDFGRTLTSNNRGSDHAWGGNQFVIGGAVQGRRIFGEYPSLAINPEQGAEVNPLDTGRGRFIPTTSCDQYFAELALWLGVNRSDLPTILPNIRNFFDVSGASAPVGFMA